jgi:hypothetical protein
VDEAEAPPSLGGVFPLAGGGGDGGDETAELAVAFVAWLRAHGAASDLGALAALLQVGGGQFFFFFFLAAFNT